MALDSKAEHYKWVADRVRQATAPGYVPDPATDADIATAEQELGCMFPESFRQFQKEFGAYSGFRDIYGVKSLPPPQQNMIEIAQFEQSEGYPLVPAHLIPFSDSGSGDSFCFDTSHFVDRECPVVFWNHEGDENQVPEQWAANFLDWLEKEMDY